MAARIMVRDLGDHAELTLTRPEHGNRLDAPTLAELSTALQALALRESLRALVLSSSGTEFCGGIDLHWMYAGACAMPEENLSQALNLTGLFKQLYDFPRPTIAKVQGDAFGAGMGLVAACDIAVSAGSARFGVRELRTGIIPAALSPYLVAAVGPRRARDYCLTARSISAAEAHTAGLVQYLCSESELDYRVEAVVQAITAGNPEAARATKVLIAAVTDRPIDDSLVTETAGRIAAFRARPLARGGLSAALNGTSPPWSAQ